ncbi:MAG: signal peptidase I [Chloroflexi bacterium]|nr:signal peptidase I [Chloroflexota bacterium]MDA1147992.1 signal peptidase I [Chloroflexota bacterium]
MLQLPGDDAFATQPLRPPFTTHAGLDEVDPWIPAAPRHPMRAVWPWGLSQLSETLEVVALAIIMFLAVRAVGQNFIVEGESMQPTFENNQLLIVNRLAYLSVDLSWLPGVDEDHWRPFGRPDSGDIVVFIYPGDISRDFIKRVIASEGQTVAIQDGVVIVDGVPQNESYLTGSWSGDLPEQVVPDGMLFVMGDNRENSFDSRNWGMLPEDLVIGRADIRYWPFDQIGMVQHPHPESAVTAELSAVR